MIDVFTLASVSQGADVRILARSVAEHLPRSRFHWFCDSAGVADRSLPVGDRALPFGQVRDLPPLAETVSPELELPRAALRLLRESDADRVLFLGPQVVLFSPPEELVSSQRGGEVVLTPVLLRADVPREDGTPVAELRALRHGVYTTHLFAVTRDSRGEDFLTWWCDRARDFVPPPDRHRSLRPWLNLAPALFPHVRVLRSPRFGVGRDNLDTRRLDGTVETGLLVDGEPLGSFDFTGVDDGTLDAAIRDGRGDQQALASVVAWYGGRRREERPRSAVPTGGGE